MGRISNGNVARQPANQAQSQLSPGIVCVGLALGCNLAWVMMAFQSLGIFHDMPDAEPVLDTTYLVSIIASIATFLFVAAFHKSLRELFGSQCARIVFPLGIMASTVLMHFGTLTTTAGTIATIVSAVASGIFTSLFMMHFGIALSLLKAKQVVVASAIGYATSTLLFFVYLFFRPFEATLFCASMAPISGFLLAQGSSALGISKGPEGNPLPAQAKQLDPTEERSQMKSLVLAFSSCMLLSGFVFEMSRSVYVQVGGFASQEVLNYALSQGGMATAVTIVSIGVTLAIVSSRSIRAPQICYRVFSFFLLLSALCLMVPIVFPAIPVSLPMAINAASFQCLNMMMWMLVCGVCSQHLDACVRTFALFRAAWAIGPFLGLLAGRFLFFGLGYSLQSAFCASAGSVLLLFLMSSFVFTETKLSKALNIIPIERKRRFVEKCQAVIERYGLTEREGEIMVMFAKGRNLPYIMEELVLSKSTVSTHRQHIYKKLGVHSSQEMIDLIQGVDV